MFAGGDFGKHEITIMLLIVGISNRLMPNLKAISDNDGNFDSLTISQCYKFLPVSKKCSNCAYICAAIFYALLLIGMSIKISTVQENPPSIGSLCPPKLQIKTSPSGEYQKVVEGLTLSSGYNPVLIRFSIPISPSILFNLLVSDIIFDQKEATDSLVRSICNYDETGNSISDYFSGTNDNTISGYYLPLLQALHKTHFKCVLIITSFIFMFFLIDTIHMCEGNTKKNAGKYFNTLIYIYYYFLYIVLCFCLILDILLPESVIWKINSLLKQYWQILSLFWGITIILGITRGINFLTNKD
jgi:hypothetical protein